MIKTNYRPECVDCISYAMCRGILYKYIEADKESSNKNGLRYYFADTIDGIYKHYISHKCRVLEKFTYDYVIEIFKLKDLIG